jgi:UDP-N-acetylglucosamine 2-epimerase (non-hydrolysing)
LKISVIFGTRPEAIKLAPVIKKIQSEQDLKCHVCVTAQHREMLDQVLQVFDIKPDVDLNLMRPNQTLVGLTLAAIHGLDAYLSQEKPDLVLVQGDTTTVFAASLAAFYHRIPVGHVEAGLRTGNKASPWPEEMNRVLTTHLAQMHFAPTEISKNNLLREGVSPDVVFVTGNTVIDALFLTLDKISLSPPKILELDQRLADNPELREIVLITGHRRENFGEGFESICLAIATLAGQYPDVLFLYPVHLNPNVRSPVERILGGKAGNHYGNILLTEPQPYLPFVYLMNRAKLIMTDSGGIQEEAPSLGKPVLVMRDTSERPEAIMAGTAKLVGTSAECIVKETATLLTDRHAYAAMVKKHNPYGDGRAAERIVTIIMQHKRTALCAS